jgi:hypothetical protein
MNIREFINYRNDCPICNEKLTTFFHSEKHQRFKYEDGRLVAIFRLNGIKKHHIDYKVGYSFGMEDNSWQIEFYNQDEIRFESDSPNFLIKRFRDLDSNLKNYKFYRVCMKCHSYNYSSNLFNLDFKTKKVIPLYIDSEYFGLSYKTNDEYRIYKLINFYNLNKSHLIYGKSQSENATKSDWAWPLNVDFKLLETGLIKFSSKVEVVNRINKLLIFS